MSPLHRLWKFQDPGPFILSDVILYFLKLFFYPFPACRTDRHTHYIIENPSTFSAIAYFHNQHLQIFYPLPMARATKYTFFIPASCSVAVMASTVLPVVYMSSIIIIVFNFTTFSSILKAFFKLFCRFSKLSNFCGIVFFCTDNQAGIYGMPSRFPRFSAGPVPDYTPAAVFGNDAAVL